MMSFLRFPALLILLCIAATVHSKEGNGTSGGGHKLEDGTFIDRGLNQGCTVIHPLKRSVRAAKAVGELERASPGFARDIRVSLKKLWVLDPRQIDECPGGETMMKLKKEPVACQSAYTVRIVQKWYEASDLAPELTKERLAEIHEERMADVTIHEMIRSLKLKPSYTVDEEEALAYLSQYIVNEDLSDEAHLQEKIHQYGYGGYHQGSYVRAYLSVLNEASQLTLEGYATGLEALEARRKVVADAEERSKAYWAPWSAEYLSIQKLFEDGKIRRKEYLKRNLALSAKFDGKEAKGWIEDAQKNLSLTPTLMDPAMEKARQLEDYNSLLRIAYDLRGSLAFATQREHAAIESPEEARERVRKAVQNAESQLLRKHYTIPQMTMKAASFAVQ